MWNKKEGKLSHFSLKCAVLLLPNVLQKFRNNFLKKYFLSSNHYLGTPGLSWNGMLDMPNEVEFFTFLKDI